LGKIVTYGAGDGSSRREEEWHKEFVAEQPNSTAEFR
jgi:hypothetical protein